MRKCPALVVACLACILFSIFINYIAVAQTSKERCAAAIADLPQQIAKAKAIKAVKEPATPAFVGFPDECFGKDAAKDAQRAAIIKKFVADAALPEQPVITALLADVHVLDTFKSWPAGQSNGEALGLVKDLALRLNTKANNFISANNKKNSDYKAVWLAGGLLALLKEVAALVPGSTDLGIQSYMQKLGPMFVSYGYQLTKRMRTNHDLSLLPTIEQIPRQAMILGGFTDQDVAHLNGTHSSDIDDFDNEVASASRCKLTVDYVLRFQNTDGKKYSYHLVGEMPVAYHFIVSKWLDGKYVYRGMRAENPGTGAIIEEGPQPPVMRLVYKQGIVEGREGTSHIKSVSHVENKADGSQATSQVDPFYDTAFVLRVLPCDPHDSAFVFSISNFGDTTENWVAEGNNGKQREFTMKGTTARGYANLFMGEWADTQTNMFVFTSDEVHNGQPVLFDKTFTSSVIPPNKGVGEIHITLTHIAKSK